MIYALAILCPPLALLLMGRGLHALLNIPLTLLFWLPGVVHAWMVIARREREYRDDRLACLLKGVTPPPPPGVKGWSIALALLLCLVTVGAVVSTVHQWMMREHARRVSVDQVEAAPAVPAAPAEITAPAAPSKPQAGALFAEVVATFGEPNLAQKETGWAYWNSFKARFQDGRLVEVVDAAETAAK
jgi:uncharacterized membrane protein YqaE (UPF0057 family)